MKKKVVRHKEQAARTAGRLPAWLDARTVGLVLAVKALLLVYGVQAFVVWKNERLGSFYDWLAIWNRWDAPHYLDIARMGYVAEGVESRWIVFFPLYPWLVRAASVVLRDELLSEEVVRARGLFRPGEVRRVVESNLSGREDFNLQVLQLLTLEMWQREFLDG